MSGGIQVRGSDGRRFSYGRDILQLYPRIAQMASNLLVMHGFHPVVRKWAEDSGCTQQDLVKAAVAMANYINLARTIGMDKTTAWTNSGLSALPLPATHMLFVFIGMVLADTYLDASLDAMPVGQAPWGAERLAEMVERHGFAAKATLPSQKEARLADANQAADKLQSPNIFDS